MAAYLISNPPARSQYGPRDVRRITGCTVLHTAESVMDTIGPDAGAESVAAFIRGRPDPGSYHDLVDSDSWVPLVPYHLAAWQDGTGSNSWALSISFACRTTDWARMSPERRRGFLRQGARAFAAQQAWRRANRLPLTELRRITRAQSDAGWSGFIYHGDRDPGRRTDPGPAFPFAEFIEHCRAALAGDLEDDMPLTDDEIERIAQRSAARTWQFIPGGPQAGIPAQDRLKGVDETALHVRELVRGLAGQVAGLQAAVTALAQAPGSPVDLEAVFRAAQDGARSIVDTLRVVAQPDA